MFVRITIICLILLNLFSLNSQVIIGGGFNSIGVLDIKKPYLGLNLLGEYREDEMSYFIKFYSTLPQYDSQSLISLEPNNPNEINSLDVNVLRNYKYNVVEFGKKYYYGKDLDFGPAGYLSSHFALIMNTVKAKVDDFDQNRYKLPYGYTDKGKIYAVSAGLNAGVQYAYFYGTYFIDFGLNYIISYFPSTSFSQQHMQNLSSFRQLFFVCNIGIKKTIHSTY